MTGHPWEARVVVGPPAAGVRGWGALLVVVVVVVLVVALLLLPVATLAVMMRMTVTAWELP